MASSFLPESSSASKLLVIVCGTACSGKTTTAAAIARSTGGAVVHSDELRYSDAKWTKKPAAEFVAAARAAVAAAFLRCRVVVYESTYFDAHDAEDARGKALKALLDDANGRGDDTWALTIEPDDLVAALGRVIDRCIARACGRGAGACPETSVNRAKLVLKLVQNYDTIRAKVAEWHAHAAARASLGARLASLAVVGAECGVVTETSPEGLVLARAP